VDNGQGMTTTVKCDGGGGGGDKRVYERKQFRVIEYY